MSFRFTTAGESHGPGLVAIVEGLPAGLRARPRGARPRHGAAPARPRPRRADEDRERLGRDPLRRAPRAHARQPDRGPGRQPRLRELGGADEPLAGRRRGRGGAPARGPATPTSSGCRSSGYSDVRNVLERASARETAARVAAGSIARAFLTALGVSVHSHVIQIGSVAAPEREDLVAGRLRRRRRGPGALPRPRRERRDGRGDRPPAQGQREPRRQLRGARLRARARARLARLLGGTPRRPPRAGGRLDPVDQGRRDRRGLGCRRAPRLGGPRRDLPLATSAATSARPTAPAASRAG